MKKKIVGYCNKCFMDMPGSWNSGEDCINCETADYLEEREEITESPKRSRQSRSEVTNKRLKDTEAGRRYLELNDVIAETLFHSQLAGRRVSLDFEENELSKIANRLELDTTSVSTELHVDEYDDVKRHMASITRDVIFVDGQVSFKPIITELGLWEKNEGLGDEPPPTILLLSILSLAAEHMAGGDGVSNRAYYKRLVEPRLLNLEADNKRIQTVYRKDADRMWESLEIWLSDRAQGYRGVPTASPIGSFPKIGWALSQALIREADLPQIDQFYKKSEFNRHIPPTNEEMQIAFDTWIEESPSLVSAHLKNLWGSKKLQDSIVDSLIQGLDRVSSPIISKKAYGNRVALVAHPKRSPFGSDLSLDLKLAFQNFGADIPEVEALLMEDRSEGIDLQPLSDDWLYWKTDAGVEVAWNQVLAKKISFKAQWRNEGESPDATFTRQPIKVVPLIYDQSGWFIQRERFELGSISMALVDENLFTQVKDILDLIAVPGFQIKKHAENKSVPKGWVWVHNIQFLNPVNINNLPQVAEAKDSQEFALAQEQFLAFNITQANSAQIYFDQGLKIPVHDRRNVFHLNYPPEIMIQESSFKNHKINIHLNGSNFKEDLTIEELKSVDFREIGKYQLRVSAINRAGKEENWNRKFQLCTADDPLALYVPEILYNPQSHPLSSLSATELEGFQISPESSQSNFDERLESGQLSEPYWRKVREGGEQTAIKTQSQNNSSVQRRELLFRDQENCDAGKHRLVSMERNNNPNKPTKWTCRNCGAKGETISKAAFLAKQRAYLKDLQKDSWENAQQETAEESDSHTLTPVTYSTVYRRPVLSAPVDRNIAFDVLCYTRAGRISWLKEIFANTNETETELPNYLNNLISNLESYGHISVKRNEDSYRPEHWMVNDPALIRLRTGSWLLVGFRSEKMLSALRSFVINELGGEVQEDNDNSASAECIRKIQLLSVDEQQIEQIKELITKETTLNTRVFKNASENLLSVLPPLSEIQDKLQTRLKSAYKEVRFYDTSTARWTDWKYNSMQTPGAYQLRAHANTYVFQSEVDLEKNRFKIGDHRTVKYLAHAQNQETMLGYIREEEVLYAPLGAELPGLYNRVAVLESGYLPERTEIDKGVLQYRGVSETIANTINLKLQF